MTVKILNSFVVNGYDDLVELLLQAFPEHLDGKLLVS